MAIPPFEKLIYVSTESILYQNRLFRVEIKRYNLLEIKREHDWAGQQ